MARNSKPSTAKSLARKATTAGNTATTRKKTKTMSTAPTTRAATDKPRKKKPTTTHRLVWRHVTARVRHTPDYINAGWSHIELVVLTPKDAPTPITATGYLSHFLDEQELIAAGGPVAFFTAWLDREARTATWVKAEFRWRQLELFPR